MDHEQRDGDRGRAHEPADRRSQSLQPRRRSRSLSRDGASRSRSPDRRGDHTRDQNQGNRQGNRHQSVPLPRAPGRRGEFEWTPKEVRAARQAAATGGPSGGQQLQLVPQQQSSFSQQGQGYQGYYQGYEGNPFSQELHPQSYPQGYQFSQEHFREMTPRIGWAHAGAV